MTYLFEEGHRELCEGLNGNVIDGRFAPANNHHITITTKLTIEISIISNDHTVAAGNRVETTALP